MSKLTERFTQLNKRARVLLAVVATLAVVAAVAGGVLAGNPPLLQRLAGRLPGMTINGCVIQPRTNCQGADLSYANLNDAHVYSSDLSGANLAHAKLVWADLSHSNLTGADLPYADLTKLRVYNADLSGSNLANATLVQADLSYTNLTGANLTDANLSAANLTGTVLLHTTMPDGSLGYANTDNIPSTPPPGDPNAFYQLRPRHVEGMCQSGNASGSASEYTMLWTCSNQASDKNQQWTFVPSGNFYQVKIGTSGYCLDVEGAALTAGATVIAHACKTEDNANQLWRLDATRDGSYLLVNKGSSLCAAPRDGGTTNDTVTVQLPCTTDAARTWGLHMQ